MKPSSLVMDVHGKQLIGVPAVHFRLAFAEKVNRLCADAATRPEAIAVELGPQTAAAASAWLRELGMGPGRREPLPCMLSLTKTNRCIRGSLRQRAAQIQRATRKDLH